MYIKYRTDISNIQCALKLIVFFAFKTFFFKKKNEVTIEKVPQYASDCGKGDATRRRQRQKTIEKETTTTSGSEEGEILGANNHQALVGLALGGPPTAVATTKTSSEGA